MADCQMCWNDWPTLHGTPFPTMPDHVEVCRNCARSMKQTVAFVRHHGLDLLTGEIAPQAGSETRLLAPETAIAAETTPGREEPPSPPAKKPAKGP